MSTKSCTSMHDHLVVWEEMVFAVISSCYIMHSECNYMYKLRQLFCSFTTVYCDFKYKFIFNIFNIIMLFSEQLKLVYAFISLKQQAVTSVFGSIGFNMAFYYVCSTFFFG